MRNDTLMAILCTGLVVGVLFMGLFSYTAAV